MTARFAKALDEVGPVWRRVAELAWEAWLSGNIPVGAVLTGPEGDVVAEGRNRVVDHEAPAGRLRRTYLAHAEIDVLAQLPRGDYEDHVLWTSLEPCLLCASAVVLSHVGTVRFAATDPLWSGLERLPEINDQTAKWWPRRLGPEDGVLGRWCAVMVVAWFLHSRPEGVVVQSHRRSAPDILDAARRVVEEGLLDDPPEELSEVGERLWPVLWSPDR